MSSFKNINKRSGFSLLELGIVLIIISVVMGGGLKIYDQFSNKSKYDETRERMRYILAAADDFYDAFGFLPAPGGVGGGDVNVTSTEFGFSRNVDHRCDSTKGYLVPTYALRIPPEYAFDAWGNRIIYKCNQNGFDEVRTWTGHSFRDDSSRRVVLALVSTGANQYKAYFGRSGRQKNTTINRTGNAGNAAGKEDENMRTDVPTITASPPIYSFDDITELLTRQQIEGWNSTPVSNSAFEDK